MNIKNNEIINGKLIKWLAITATVIVLLNFVNILIGEPSWQITRLIFLGFESNFPTWFSSLLLATAAFWAYRCSQISCQGQWTWQVLSLGFLAMSCDEVAMIHEHLGGVIKKYVPVFHNIKTPFMATVAPFIVVGILIFTNKIRKYLNGSTKARRMLITGLLVYITGFWVLELTNNFFYRDILKGLWHTEVVLEESFEMLGVIIMIKGLAEHYNFLLKKPFLVEANE